MSARHVVLRRRGLSVRLERRALAVLVVLAAVAAAAFVLEVGRGEFPIAPLDVLATLTGGGDDATRFVVLDLRLPRALTALLAGAALGLAGAVFQDLARNPLVSPDVIGVSSGAALAAIALIVFGDASGLLAVPLAALAGALAAGVALYALAWRGGVHGYRLVLVGIGVAALLQAGISYVLTRGQLFEVQLAYVWMVGSLNGRGWEHVWPLLAVLAASLPVALALARRLEVLQLGDDVARALGIDLERTRLALLALAVVLTAVAVAASGPIAFCAFIAPHLARRVGRTVAPLAVLPLAATAGAVILLVADLVGRTAFAPREIPVGIVVAILAAPYFLLLLRRANRLGVTG